MDEASFQFKLGITAQYDLNYINNIYFKGIDYLDDYKFDPVLANGYTFGLSLEKVIFASKAYVNKSWIVSLNLKYGQFESITDNYFLKLYDRIDNMSFGQSNLKYENYHYNMSIDLFYRKSLKLVYSFDLLLGISFVYNLKSESKISINRNSDNDQYIETDNLKVINNSLESTWFKDKKADFAVAGKVLLGHEYIIYTKNFNYFDTGIYISIFPYIGFDFEIPYIKSNKQSWENQFVFGINIAIPLNRKASPTGIFL